MDAMPSEEGLVLPAKRFSVACDVWLVFSSKLHTGGKINYWLTEKLGF